MDDLSVHDIPMETESEGTSDGEVCFMDTWWVHDDHSDETIDYVWETYGLEVPDMSTEIHWSAPWSLDSMERYSAPERGWMRKSVERRLGLFSLCTMYLSRTFVNTTLLRTC